MIDSTSRQQAAAAKKAGADHRLGRSPGGLTTKIHAVVDAQGLPVQIASMRRWLRAYESAP